MYNICLNQLKNCLKVDKFGLTIKSLKKMANSFLKVLVDSNSIWTHTKIAQCNFRKVANWIFNHQIINPIKVLSV